MLGLAEIRDWIKNFGIGENFYIGKLDNKKDKSIGIYQRRTQDQTYHTAIGGINCTKVNTKHVSILLHWNKNARETEEAANDLFEKIIETTDITIAKKHIYYVRMDTNEPIDVGTDEKGIYERVIWITFFYER